MMAEIPSNKNWKHGIIEAPERFTSSLSGDGIRMVLDLPQAHLNE